MQRLGPGVLGVTWGGFLTMNTSRCFAKTRKLVNLEVAVSFSAAVE